MGKKKPSTDAAATFSLNWSYAPRVSSELLGERQYSKPEHAIRELVANAFDAEAKRVSVDLVENKLLGIDRIRVHDNGKGMTKEVLEQRFVVVGAAPVGRPAAMGRFGIGRLGVFRLGQISHWYTVTNENGRKTSYRFKLSAVDGLPTRLPITSQTEPDEAPTGTQLEITNLRHGLTLTDAMVAQDLQQHFCSLLLANPSLELFVNEQRIEVAPLIMHSEEERFTSPGFGEVLLRHLRLKKRIDGYTENKQLVFTSCGREARREIVDNSPGPEYLAIVDSATLENAMTTDRTNILQFEADFLRLRTWALSRIKEYGQRQSAKHRSQFLIEARRQPYYPFRSPPANPVAAAEQQMYDILLETVHEHVNLTGLSKGQSRVIFKLLKRALDNENLLVVLSEIADLSDDDVTRFRELLERTTLDSIIRMSTEVTRRLEFLDVLHDLNYGDVSRRLKERKHFHKIVEPHSWLFGPQFQLATSDKAFRTLIREHRESVGLIETPEADLEAITGLGDIPDLFFVASRDYPTDPRHHHLIVELKAPRVVIADKEKTQVIKYARTLHAVKGIAQQSACFDIYLMGAEVHADLDFERKQQTDRPFGCILKSRELNIWVLQWSEVIERARDELKIVRDNLNRRSKELSVSDYLRDSFPNIHEDLYREKAEDSGRTGTMDADSGVPASENASPA